ncbi:MAG: glutamine synthetase family protein [Patescibacteria group bacterium]|jgi:glutamine synthetase
MSDTSLRTFLEIPYDELEARNVSARKAAITETQEALEKEYRAYLTKEKRIKAVTLCFTDIEGRFHMLDYDKKFFLSHSDNLTFDGSSIRGFSVLKESDLRLEIDWASIRWLPSDIFGPGKVVMFAYVQNRDRSPYLSDFRSRLRLYTEELKKKQGVTAFASTEIEGFVVRGVNAEQMYTEEKGFELISGSGYYHSLPLDELRVFIDRSAEAQRAMGFQNEKDHPEVAPAQFELNFTFTDVLTLADTIQLYKLVCRQVANNLGMTATFLPKPVAGINGSGMHINLSLGKNGKNIFYKKNGADGLSNAAWDAVSKLLNHAPELCLLLNPSVNAYRRLDPHFEAPNQIKVSAIDRGSMIRIPVADERSARIEIRSVAPDVNPYVALYSILKIINEGSALQKDEEKRDRVRFLPGNIYDAIRLFKASDFMGKILGEDNQAKYAAYKQSAADRSPKDLGTIVKKSEIIYHHEVTNQMLWNRF